MTFFLLNTLKCDARFCSARQKHRWGVEAQIGRPIREEMNEDGVEKLRYVLDEDEGGLEVGDFLTGSCLALGVSRRFGDALANFDLGPRELIPIEIYNAKDRLHVPDAVLVNPLEQVDCLDPARTEMDGDTKNPMVRIFGKWCLRQSLIPEGRDLFRVKGLIGYVFSEKLVDFTRAQDFTNLPFEEASLS